jgi:CRP-like cAMP-binding protein
VVALTDVTMCMFDAERLGELLGDTGLSHRAARSQALALRRAADRLTAIGARDARSNLLHFLLDLHDRLKPRNMTQADGFKMPLTQQHLAEAVGATVVHVHRTLRMLRHEGLLTLDRGRVVFHDMARLREIAGVPERTHEPEPLL